MIKFKFATASAIGFIVGYSLSKFTTKENRSDLTVTSPPQDNHKTQRLGDFLSSNDSETFSRGDFIVSYDSRNKNPRWVLEHLTKENLEGGSDRSKLHFKEDNLIKRHLRGHLEAYKGSNYDRGHLAPAASHKNSMKETFLLSNICPQDREFNRGYIASVDKFIRSMVNEFQDVYVMTGPLYVPTLDGDKWVHKYDTIGSLFHWITVPNYFFKIVIARKSDGIIGVGSFMFPNAPIASETPLYHFTVPINMIESLAGLSLSAFNEHDKFQIDNSYFERYPKTKKNIHRLLLAQSKKSIEMTPLPASFSFDDPLSEFYQKQLLVDIDKTSPYVHLCLITDCKSLKSL
jgi:endonuclease G, mitochondrial